MMPLAGTIYAGVLVLTQIKCSLFSPPQSQHTLGTRQQKTLLPKETRVKKQTHRVRPFPPTTNLSRSLSSLSPSYLVRTSLKTREKNTPSPLWTTPRFEPGGCPPCTSAARCYPIRTAHPCTEREGAAARGSFGGEKPGNNEVRSEEKGCGHHTGACKEQTS